MDTQVTKIKLAKIVIIIELSIILFLTILLGFVNNKHKLHINYLNSQLDAYKTIIEEASYVKDSIEYNIIYRDSIVVEIKKELQYETELVKNLTDDESVVMFNNLVWSE